MYQGYVSNALRLENKVVSMAELFYLQTRRHGGNYYVRFKLEDGSLSNFKSTGTTNYNEAKRIAYNWLSTGNIPARMNSKTPDQSVTDLEKLNLMNKLKTTEFDFADIQKIIDILVDRKLLVSGIIRATPESRDALEFFNEFWEYEISPYAKENKVLGSELSRSYFATNKGRIKNYWTSRLAGKYLGEITPDDVAAIYQDPKLMDLAPKTVKGIIDSVVVPLKWAYQKHLTQISGFDNIPHVKVKTQKEREIVPLRTIPDVFSAKWENEMSRLANLVGMYTGMRTGEVQALRAEDIFEDHIHVKHSWDRFAKDIKPTKTGEERDVPISKELYDALMNQLSFNPRKDIDGKHAFIFFGDDPSRPVNQRLFNKYLHRALADMGYENPEEISFYSWRHGFCTEARGVVNDDRVVRSVSGHKTQQMFEHYSKHIEHDASLATMSNAAQELFGDIVTKTLNTPIEDGESA